MVSASTIVDSRWAITTNVVRSRIAASACCIACSVPESMLAVASSRINICGASTSTRASANSCFCPTDSVFPCSPRCVCSPSLRPRARSASCTVSSACEIYAASERLAHELNGHYMDQFTYAERATDWRGNNNIADSIFRQMRNEPHPVPRFIVMSAGTGGTSATIGRYIRCQGYDTQLMVVDPENSVFLPYWQDRDASLRSPVGSKIEGIGRPRVEPSFIPDVVDEMLRVPDAASVATAHWLETQLGRKVGASTGTNMWGALQLAARMREAGETGAIVTLLCDSGDRYLDTYYHPAWVSDHIGDLTPWSAAIAKLLTGD